MRGVWWEGRAAGRETAAVQLGTKSELRGDRDSGDSKLLKLTVGRTEKPPSLHCGLLQKGEEWTAPATPGTAGKRELKTRVDQESV